MRGHPDPTVRITGNDVPRARAARADEVRSARTDAGTGIIDDDGRLAGGAAIAAVHPDEAALHEVVRGEQSDGRTSEAANAQTIDDDLRRDRFPRNERYIDDRASHRAVAAAGH